MCKNIRDSYKLYRQTADNPVDVKIYILFNNEYNKFLVEKVFDGNEVTLPMRSGTLSITGRKQKVSFDEEGKIKGLAPDWVKTKQLWATNPQAKEKKQLLYHTNSHTDNTIYRFLWSKKRILTENKILYSLKMTRDNKRKVHNLIKEGKKYVTRN